LFVGSSPRIVTKVVIGDKAMRWLGAICFVICFGGPAMAQRNGSDTGAGIAGLVLVVLCLVIYFLPALIGSKRRISASGALFFVNLVFGWTVLGWFLCLIWAATGATRAQDAFFEKAAAQPRADPTADRAYQAAYAKERARLDHEAAQNARRRAPYGDL
jgi:Superinfection immunity protein